MLLVGMPVVGLGSGSGVGTGGRLLDGTPPEPPHALVSAQLSNNVDKRMFLQ